MQMNQVRYFLTLCQERNFTRAAKRCGVSRPSLWNPIKRLEQIFGGPLFRRDRKKVELTEVGRVVRPYLERLNQSSSEAKRRAKKGPYSIRRHDVNPQHWRRLCARATLSRSS